MRALITGATGVAGRHLTSSCAAQGHEVHALTRPGREGAVAAGAAAHAIDLTDGRALAGLLWYGLLFMAMVLWKPDGIAGLWQDWRQRRRRRSALAMPSATRAA